MGDEADHLNDIGAFGEYDQQIYYAELNEMQKRYADNKRAEVGTIIRCACCATKFIKKTKQSQFCSNKGKGNCKDTYWNNIDDSRRERSHRYA